MKLATFEVPTPAGPLRRIGAAMDRRLVDLQAAYAAHLERTDPGCDAERLAALLIERHGPLPWHGRARDGGGGAGHRRCRHDGGSLRRPHDLRPPTRSASSLPSPDRG